MAINQLTDDLDIHQGLPDEPNSDGGYSAEELKVVFDQAGNTIKAFINTYIVDVLNSIIESESGADNIGCNRIYEDSTSIQTIKGQLEKIKEEIEGVTQGAVPDGSLTDAKLSNDSGQIKETVENLGTEVTDLSNVLSTSYYTSTEADGRYLRREQNLSDLNNLVTARTNLSVYSKSETDTAVGLRLLKTSNLSDLNSISTARSNLSVYSKTEADGRYLNEDSNLSDLPSKSTSRSNLGLGTMATRDVVVQTTTPTYVADRIWLKPIS